ncbi:MAG: hypothetical protein HC769_37610 [Cyanobacteria bacterium CRU_2_1]|nr:hypothetical protein [Cyanobacteria bacterium CRU_2_1]
MVWWYRCVFFANDLGRKGDAFSGWRIFTGVGQKFGEDAFEVGWIGGKGWQLFGEMKM